MDYQVAIEGNNDHGRGWSTTYLNGELIGQGPGQARIDSESIVSVSGGFFGEEGLFTVDVVPSAQHGHKMFLTHGFSCENGAIPTVPNPIFWPTGDSNFDGAFDSSDLIAVFQAGEYEDGILDNSHWSEGDWNGDYDFSSFDMVLAFQDGSYEQAAAVAVPEPAGNRLIVIATLTLGLTRLVSTGKCRH